MEEVKKSKEEYIKFFKLNEEFERTGINFVALDLETATMYRDSICEIGIAVVENGEIKESRNWLIKPPGNEYYDFNIAIHNIHPEDTADKPEIKEVWKEVVPYLEGKVVVAHNTAFDMYVLRDTFIENDITFPSFANFCSCRLAKKVVNCYSYSLDNVCAIMEIEMDGHHRAKADAEACAKVFIKTLEMSGALSYADLMDKYHFNCGIFTNNYFRPQRAIKDYSNKKKLVISDIVGDPSKVDEDNYFYDKEVCFTGKCMYAVRKDLLQMVADIGGIPANSVTSHTDILVVGQQDYRVVGESGMSSKQKKAMSLRDKGQDIEILSEAEFLSMISI